VPILPLGNVSAGVAWVYAAFALAWLALAWRDARSGLFFVAGAALAPLSLLGVVPLAAQIVRGRGRRAAQAFAAVVFAAVVCGVSGSALPFTDSAAGRVPLAQAQGAGAALQTLWHVLTSHPALLLEAVVIAAAAAALPLARRRVVAPFGLLLLAGILAPDPHLPDLAIVATVAATCLGLAARAES
jgi:hypothetical protein